jgi:4-hydroxy-tetrahydrodipicolinate synthase
MFSGSMVAIVTPMTAEGALDWPAWDRLLDFHLREGTDGIVVAGTTGESPVLSADETEELTRRAVARCRDKVQVIVGAGSNATDATAMRTRSLSRLGVDGVMLVTPYYNKPPQEGLYRHFMAAADASAVPVILYNVPSRTAVDLLPSTVARLARHPHIVAIKEATASLSRAREILGRCHCHRFNRRGCARRHFGFGECRAAPHARGGCCSAVGRFGRGAGDRCQFTGFT